MRRFVPALTPLAFLSLLLLAAAPSVHAELLSKKYEFKGDVILEMGVQAGNTLRLDHVYFQLPATVNGQITRTSGPLTADVAVSNTSQGSAKVGIAIGLFDDEGNLVGAASGGSKVSSIKPGRQKTFRLSFSGVTAGAHRSETFQISIESQP